MPERLVTVHIGVNRTLQSDLTSGGAAKVEELARRLHLSRVRDDRLATFGVITGEADASAIDTIRNEPGIDFVEQDSMKRATTDG